VAIFIHGGRLVSAVDSFDASILVEDGRIAAVGQDLDPPPGAEICDASGKLVLPGVVDVHVHVGLELRGHRSSGFEETTREAALGGVTTFLTYAHPEPGESLVDVVERRRREAEGRACIDYGLHAALVRWNEREDDEILALIESGIPSFKAYTAYSDAGLRSDDEELYRALLLTGQNDAIVEVHCENEWMIDMRARRAVEENRLSAIDHARSRPGYVEGEAVAAVLRAAYDAGAPVYIVHVSSGEGIEAIGEALDLGVEVYCETCPQFLLLDEDLLTRPDGHRYATCPPLRTAPHREAVWEGLEDGLVSAVATDHCAFAAAEKDAGAEDFRKIPMGLPGVGTLLPLMWHFGVGGGRMSENELVDRLSTNPCEIFGLHPAKGSLAVGTDADLVIFDPDLERTISPALIGGHADYTAYDGWETRGWPVSTMVRGAWVVKDRQLVGSLDHGRFVPRGKACRRPGRR